MANIELDGANKKIKVDSGDLTLDVPGDIILDADGADVVFADGGTNILKVTNSSSDVVFQPQVDAKDIIFKQYDGTTVATVEDNGTFNIPTDKLAINSTAVTATAAELNLIDGGTARGTTALADGDGILINDGGTMRMTNVTTVKTYMSTSLDGIDDQSSSNDDQLTITDTAVVINEDSDDVDFRVESNGNANMLFVSGGNDVVGISNEGDLGTGLHIKIADTGASVNSAADELVIEGTSTVGMSFLTNNDQDSNITFGDSDANERGRIQYSHGSDFMAFHTNADEAMRINSNHSFNFNYGNNNNAAVTMYVSGQLNNTAMAVRHGTSSSTDEILIAFTDGADQACGQIRVNPNANTVSYGTSSDYRLKENVNYNFDATTELKKLKPAKFNWKTNSSLTIEGFLAHEVADVVPLAVQGAKDETEVIPNGVYNANGNLQRKDVSEDEWTKGKANGVFASDTTWSASKTIPKYQVIDQAKLVPLLVKTVQELEARIKTLEG